MTLHSGSEPEVAVYRIIEEPVGETYRALIAFALRYSATFSLVWRYEDGMLQTCGSSPAPHLELDLEPFLVRTIRTSEWPGTLLLNSQATVRRYRATIEAFELLSERRRLFAWASTPEDPAFYDGADRCWFGCIAHEGEAWVIADDVLLAALFEAVPRLRLEPVRRHSSSRP